MKTKTILQPVIYLLSFFIFFYSNCSLLAQENKPLILVSIAPHKFFVDKIAQHTVDVYLMVPAGVSAHTYEPTSRQILTASRGEIWFKTGESFETRAIKALQSYQSSLDVVDMRCGLDLIQHAHGHKGCCCGSEDLHYWLSARQARIQAQTITQALIKHYPQHAELFKKNLASFEQELESLDYEISRLLSSLKNRTILVSHPAYGYFCRDYHLEQLSIEIEGKDPAPQQMTRLLNQIRELKLSTIYIQMQYTNKAAKLIAQTIGARLVTLDPYSENYLVTMKEIANAFADGDK